jgi:hypothetical protein
VGAQVGVLTYTVCWLWFCFHSGIELASDITWFLDVSPGAMHCLQ